LRALALALLLIAAAPAAAQDEGQEGTPVAPEAREETTPPRSGPDPVRFELPVPAERGGGTVTGTAGDLEFVRDDYVVLSGGVEAKYQDVEFEADRVEVDLATSVLTAEGRVIVDQGPRRLSGATLTWLLETKTGTLTEAAGHVAPDYFFEGAEVAKIAEDVYTVTDGTFTSCTGDQVPDWSFRLGRATVEVEGYARVHHATMLVKKVPLLYSPYVLWPVKTERTSGMLVPNVGYSQRRGAYLGLAYYHVLGRSYDSTTFFDGYGEGYAGIGEEFRYRPTAGTEGAFRGYAIDDQEQDEWRWKVELDHESNDLPWGLRGVASVRKTSDFDFFRDFERDFDRAARRFELSRAFVSGSWGPHLLNVEVSDQETFFSGQPNAVDRRLPEIDYTLRSTKLGGTPLALQIESSVGYLSVDRSPGYDSRYGRVHAVPELSLPINPVPWLSLELFAGERFTWYGDSLDDSGQAFTGEGLTRSGPFAGAGLIGPSFARIFTPKEGDAPAGGGGESSGAAEGEAEGEAKKGFGKYLHVIEPRFVYRWQDAYEDQRLVPRFDSVDGFASGNVGTISLINRLKAKPRDERAGGGSRDVATLEISRSYSFDEDEPLEGAGAAGNNQFGPYLASLRVNPSRALILEARATYSGLFSRLTSTSLSTDLRLDRGRLGVRWNTNVAGPTGETLSDQYRFSGGLEVVPGRLLLQAWVDYDAERSMLQEHRYFLDYNSQCWSVHLEYRDYSPGTDLRERDYRLSFTLKNVGSFIDLTGRFD
jgi:LPS-assembly protein